MLLTISTDHRPATDLGYLLHKNPARLQTVELSFGNAHVFYPQADDQRCTAALFVDVDAVGLVRKPQKGRRTASLFDYVSDRPYTAGSLLSAAIGKAFGTALTGRSKERPELASEAIALEIHVPVAACRVPGTSSDIVERLFGPLGWTVETSAIELDQARPDWGPGPHRSLRLQGVLRLKEALEHLYVLLPVLDGDQHYWVNEGEVDRLLRRGSDWLAAHPERELIARRFLKQNRRLTDDAMARLAELDESDPSDPGVREATSDADEGAMERPLSLNDQRLDAVVAAISSLQARSVVDLGCGEAKLLKRLLAETSVDKLLGVDVSHRSLQVAARRSNMEQMPPRQAERIELRQSGLTYRDPALAGFDVAVLMEVIEHVDPPRLQALERVVFDAAAPNAAIVTTPNIEYNARFDGLAPGQLRHRDHRFEWTRQEFANWIAGIADRHGYQVRVEPVGAVDGELGPPTQMAVFTR